MARLDPLWRTSQEDAAALQGARLDPYAKGHFWFCRRWGFLIEDSVVWNGPEGRVIWDDARRFGIESISIRRT